VQLKASCNRFMTDITEKLYIGKMSKHRLSNEEWDEVLSNILKSQTSESPASMLPTIEEINRIVWTLLESRRPKVLTGHYCFKLPNGQHYACPVWYDGQWKMIKYVTHDRKTIAQKTDTPFVPPPDALDLHLSTKS